MICWMALTIALYKTRYYKSKTRTLWQSWSAITSGLCHDWCDPSLLYEGCSNRDSPDYVGLDGRPLDSLVGVPLLGAAVRLTGTRLIATVWYNKSLIIALIASRTLHTVFELVAYSNVMYTDAICHCLDLYTFTLSVITLEVSHNSTGRGSITTR